MVKGGNNTQFFHLFVTEKQRRKKIIQLEQDEGIIVGNDNIKLYISNFYKKLLRDPNKKFVSLDDGVVEISHNSIPMRMSWSMLVLRK